MGQVVTSGQTTTVASGSTAGPTDVQSGGTLVVSQGGAADDTTIEGGGQVNDYGLVSGVSAVNGSLYIANGGVASGVVFSRGYLTVASGGQLHGGTASGTIDANDDGGFLSVQEVDQGGVAYNTLLDQGGLVFLGGTEVNLTASGRSNDIVDSGALVYSGINAQVSASITGYGLIDLTGAPTHVTVSDIDQPNFFGTFTGDAVIGAGTVLELAETDALGSGTVLFTNGVGSGTLILDGNASPSVKVANFFSGSTIVVTGGVDSAAQVSPNLVQLFYANGTEDDITIAGASSPVIGIFTGNGETIISSYIQPTEIDFGDDADVSDNESNYLVEQGGTVNVTSGGTLSQGSIGDGQDDGSGNSAVLNVQANGSSINSLVTGGGVEDVQAGGVSMDDTVFAGGTQEVDLNGTSFDPVINGGMLVDNGTVAFGTLGNSPASGTINVLSGTGTVQTGSGSVQLQGDASGFDGTIMVQGQGRFTVSHNTNLNSSASIVFSGGGSDPTVEFDDQLNNLPRATISGFTDANDVIDLRALNAQNTTSTPYASYVQAFVTSGGSVLSLTSGGNSTSLNLDSGTTGSGPLDLVADGSGGTDISFSTLSAGTAAALKAAVDSAATLTSGTFTVFLTGNVVLTSDGGGTPSPDPIQALNGGTVVLNGEGFAVTPGPGGDTLLHAAAGPVVVTQLGGAVGVEVDGGAHLTVTSNTYTGNDVISSGTLEVADTAASAGEVSFVSGGGAELLQVDAAALANGAFGTPLLDFGANAGEALDLAGFSFVSGQTSASLLSAGTMLSVTNGATTALFALGGTDAGAYHVFDDANGGTIVTADSVACFVTGTLILTESGERPVETLAIGDGVVTVSGAVRPVRWVGWRSYRGRFLAGRPALWPVCVQAGALSDGVPARDLLVSPLHALLIDGVLVPARALVNGSSVTPVPGLTEIGYWHVELDDHDALFANGAPAETFVDDGSRGLFVNAASAPKTAGEAEYCAPRVEHGAVLETIRARLAYRVAGALAA